MIVLAGRKRSPAGKALFGSVTQDVILGTDRSVLVVSSERDED
nr:universal stress protein [Halomicroarcula sp. XH51]